jgi:hypothetical protein
MRISGTFDRQNVRSMRPFSVNNTANNVSRNDQQLWPTEILDRLGAVERLLQEQADTLASLPRREEHTSPGVAVETPLLLDQNPIFSSPSDVTRSQVNYEDYGDIPLTIPVGHQTATANLFTLPSIKRMIGDYSDDYFYQVESQRSLPFPLNMEPLSFHETVDLDKAITDELVQTFFMETHPNLPIMDRKYFDEVYEQFSHQPFAITAPSALSLMVFALGKLAGCMRESLEVEMRPENGLDYFQAAYSIIARQWLCSFEGDIAFPLALVWASLYLNYMIWPLHAWRMIHMASTQLQMMLSP